MVDIWFICGCYVVAIWLLCSCYVVAMFLLFGWYVVAKWLLCDCYFVVPMWLLCSCYVVAMWLLCVCYVVFMWLQFVCSYASLWFLYSCFMPSSENPAHHPLLLILNHYLIIITATNFSLNICITSIATPTAELCHLITCIIRAVIGDINNVVQIFIY